MASAKAKRIQERLEQIKAQATELNAGAKDDTPAALAEEAAGLGLELVDLLLDAKGK